ncbi:MAG: IS630 transposase-related protein [Candidatus Poribacteria bacterium]|nr:IS630 transposase-related protein [Candidatus Poribacteria bacterium]
MRYSPDLRKRVLDFIADGGSKAEASRRFSVSRRCIYNWLEATDPFTYEKPGPRKPYRIDLEALTEHVKAFPDSTQKERAAHFSVSQRCICYGLKKIGYTRKKRHSLTRNNAL